MKAFNRQSLSIYGPALLVALVGFWIAYQFVQPAPPDRIVVTTGGKEGAYYMFAQQYREILARNDITVDIRDSAGSLENIERLHAKQLTWDGNVNRLPKGSPRI